MSSSGKVSGKYPAIVLQYNASNRTCLVSIPNITDGDGNLVAEIEYPIGDRSQNTEIKILAGDKVWCEFIQGDPRYPIITGYRNPKIGNSEGTRHFEHANINLTADTKITLSVGGVSLTLTSSSIALLASNIGLKGSSSADGGMVIDGISFGDHIHAGKHGDTSPPK